MIAKIIDSKTIHIYDLLQFNVYAIMNSGQVFCDPPCDIVEKDGVIVINATGDKDSNWLWNYFDLDTDYRKVKEELQQFKVLSEPMLLGGGIRILRQPIRATIVSFIISANNNIPRIRKTVQQLDFEDLGKYSETDFKQLGCGYRAPYLVGTIKAFLQIDVEKWRMLCNERLREQLMQLPGVGRKVADCIMLFAFCRLDVAPVDVHIRRAIERLGKGQADAILNHKYAGVAQQYLFYYVQHLKKEI